MNDIDLYMIGFYTLEEFWINKSVQTVLFLTRNSWRLVGIAGTNRTTMMTRSRAKKNKWKVSKVHSNQTQKNHSANIALRFFLILRKGEKDMSIEEMWNTLLILGVSEETLNIVKCINGYSKETMQDILYATTGYRSFEQIEVK